MRDLLTEEECDGLCAPPSVGARDLRLMVQAAARLGAERERERAAREREVLQYEAAKARAMLGAAVGRLARIQSFVHPDGFVVNGKTYGFHPPDNLVRELWEALSKAIREIDIEAIRRGEGE